MYCYFVIKLCGILVKNAIVIDDDKDTVRIFSDFLEENHVKVVGKGYNGKDAIDLFKEKTPDVVFLDVMMPDGSGFHAIRKIREIDPDSIIFVVTADSKSTTEKKLEKLKTNAIVYKPFDIKQILQIISSL